MRSRHPRSRWPLLALAATMAACTPHVSATPAPAPAREGVAALRATFDSLAALPAFRNAHWGILVYDPTSGDTLYSHDAGKLFMPASNMKLVSGGVALAQLGPDYRWRTTLAAAGPVREGVLDGDLLVIGRGDPSVSDHMMKDAMAPLRALADSLAARGITRVRGRLTTGGDAFPGPTLGFGWAWDDLEDSYSAPVDELLFNEGFSEVKVRGGERAGSAAQVETRPATTFPRLRVAATTIPRPALGGGDSATATSVTARKDTATGEVVIEGQVRAGDTLTIEVTHRDPDAAYLAAFGEALRARGIAVDGEATARATTADTLVRFDSPTLREVLPALMKPSQNQIAEMFFRTLGLERAGRGAPDSARAVEGRQLVEWGAPADGFVLRDGSGLSRYDYLSPETIVHVLDAMRRSPSFDVFYAALPIAGVDGTIRSRMRATPAQGNVHAKTGTLANARSLSGYVTTADGRMLEFVALCNNYTVPVGEVNRVQDAIAVALASWRR